MLPRSLLALGAVSVVLGACNRNPAERTYTTGAEQGQDKPRLHDAPRGGELPAPRRDDFNRGETDRITAERCRRERVCGNVGSGKKWADESACKKELGDAMNHEVEASACETMIPDHVEACIDEMRVTSCENVESNDKVESCRASTLCGK